MSSPPTSKGSRTYSRGFRGFLRGLSYPYRGCFFLLKTPRVWGHAAIPTLVTVFLVVAFSLLSIVFMDDVAAFLLPDSWDTARWWGKLASVTAGALAVVLCLMAAWLAALTVSVSLAGPLYELLSEAVERLYLEGDLSDERMTLAGIATDIVRALWTASQRLILFGIVYVPLVIASFIPVLGLLFAALLFIYSAFFVSLTFLEPCQDRYRMSFKEKLYWGHETMPAYMGFGFSSVLLLLIPCASIVLSSGLVAGATLLWADTGGRGQLVPNEDPAPPEGPSSEDGPLLG